jgi:hypothetical protein
MDKEFIERLIVVAILSLIMTFINLICIWKG